MEHLRANVLPEEFLRGIALVGCAHGAIDSLAIQKVAFSRGGWFGFERSWSRKAVGRNPGVGQHATGPHAVLLGKIPPLFLRSEHWTQAPNAADVCR